MPWLNRTLIIALLCSLAASPALAQFDSVGSLKFPTSTESPEAQSHFLRGVAILHSFGWKQAIEQFQAAQNLDSDFVLAYWGETLCYNHPLFGGPTPDEDNPRKVLARLGSTRAARAAKATTDREAGFLNAVEVLWSDEGSYDERRVAYMEAMADLHERYPNDHEVATFYAVATLSASRALRDRTSLRYPLLRRSHPRSAGPTLCDEIHGDRASRSPRQAYANAHFYPARHVGPCFES